MFKQDAMPGHPEKAGYLIMLTQLSDALSSIQSHHHHYSIGVVLSLTTPYLRQSLLPRFDLAGSLDQLGDGPGHLIHVCLSEGGTGLDQSGIVLLLLAAGAPEEAGGEVIHSVGV